MNCRLCDGNGFATAPISGRPERCPCMDGKPVHIVTIEPGSAHAPRGLYCVLCDPLQKRNGVVGLHVGTFVMISRVAWLPNGRYANWDPSKQRSAKPENPERVAICMACVGGIAATMTMLQSGQISAVAHGVAHMNQEQPGGLVLV